MSTWFITGCSTGLGRALAAAVLDHGDRAAITARDTASLDDLVAAHPDTALPLRLDVTDPIQVAEAVGAATARFGGIDVLVNNAGYGYRGAIEEGDPDQVDALFATNLFGPINLIKQVLPGMRAAHSGTILNVSSIGARICPPGSGYYSSVKAALEAMTFSLAKEVGPLGIRAVVVEPGGFRTDFGGRSIVTASTIIADYADTAGARRPQPGVNQSMSTGGDPDRAAAALIALVESEQVPELFMMGSDAVDAVRGTFSSLAADVDDFEALSRSTDAAD